jgi:hypothetical protein
MQKNSPILQKLRRESPSAAVFIEAVLAELEGSDWVKAAFVEFIRHPVDEACDAAALIHEAMARRAAEASGEKFDGDILE